MNLHHLRVFHEVATTGSVTRAAEQLHISQPAVSVQVKRLEHEIGLALLRAEGRRVRLTPAGEMLAAQARRLFALEREMEGRLEEWRAGRAGLLRLGATNLPGHYLLPRFAAQFKRLYPDVDVQVQTANSQGIFQRLHEYEADAALMAGGWDEPGIVRELIWEDELWFIVPRDHPLNGRDADLSQLADQPFSLREEGSSTRRRLLALFELRGWTLQAGLAFASLGETIRSVEAGYGVALAPSLAVQGRVAAGRLGRVRVRDVRLPMPITFCRREGEGLSPVAEAFYDMLRRADWASVGLSEV